MSDNRLMFFRSPMPDGLTYHGNGDGPHPDNLIWIDVGVNGGDAVLAFTGSMEEIGP